MSFNYQKYIAFSVLLREEIELRGARLEFQSCLHLGVVLHLRGNGVVPRTAVRNAEEPPKSSVILWGRGRLHPPCQLCQEPVDPGGETLLAAGSSLLVQSGSGKENPQPFFQLKF